MTYKILLDQLMRREGQNRFSLVMRAIKKAKKILKAQQNIEGKEKVIDLALREIVKEELS